MERQISVGQHLRELRRRIIICTLTVMAGALVGFFFHEPLVEVLKRPGDFGGPDSPKLIATQLTENLGVTMKVSVVAGLVLAFPIVLYQAVRFVAPGLTGRELRYLLAFLPASLICFAAGCAFAYFVLLPPALGFLLDWGSELATPHIRISNYVNTTVMLLFWMGVVFETPVVMFLLAKLGIVTARQFSVWRRYWVVVAFILAALITPTIDPVNQALVAAPLIVMYELGVLLAKLARRGKAVSPASVAT